MLKRIGKSTVAFRNPPVITGFSSVAGKKEGEGPLGPCFDFVADDDSFGETTWEKAESKMMKDAVNRALNKADLTPNNIEYMFSGDLLNQCIVSSYGLRDFNISFFGLYGACSTMAESIILAAMAVDGEFASNCVAVTSSHFCTAERQFRFPLEYGGQRTPTAQWTVTGSGAVVIQDRGQGPFITHATAGKIIDYGETDINNMGAAMAPAAVSTMLEFFQDTDTKPQDYDLIITGDLSKTGADLVMELMSREGIDLGKTYTDCGLLIYDREKQEAHSGGSGCGCSALVLAGHILPKIVRGELRNVLLISTGALMSPTSIQQGESIPAVAHLVKISFLKS